MSWTTRLWGDKVDGESLDRLLESMGESGELPEPFEGFAEGNKFARVSIKPYDEGLEVDMYLYRQDIPVGEMEFTYMLSQTDDLTPLVAAEHPRFERHIEGHIKYSNILKDETK